MQDLILGVAKRAGISEQEAETFVRTVFTVISDSLGDEKVVKIRNLGTFKLVEVDDRETVDAVTGTTTRIKGYRKIVFTPDNALKDLINKPFAQFETVVLNEATDTADMERGAEPTPGEEDEPDEMGEDLVDEEATEISDAETESEPSLEPQEEDPEDNSGTSGESLVEEAGHPADNEQKEENTLGQDAEETEESSSLSAGNTETGSDGKRESDCITESAPDDEKTLEEETASANIEYQHADYQKVQEQKVDELNVATQNVEHQTIEHQSIVHQGRTENERNGGTLRLTQGGMIALFVFILVLMAGSYLAGYYRILLPGTAVSSESSELAQTDTVQKTAAPVVVPSGRKAETAPSDSVRATEKQTAAPAVSQKTASDTKEKQAANRKNTADSLKQLKANASKYPQVKGGAYLIVGVKSVHKLKSGENLLRLAQKVYGSRNFVRYIIIMNQIKDPDLVQIGTEIKLPELLKSSDKL